VELVSDLIIQKLETMVEGAALDEIFSKRKAINTLFPYAIFLEQDGRQEMIDIILRAARVSDSESTNLGKFIWRRVVLYISKLFEQQSPASLNRVITLISPYVPWEGVLGNPTAVSRWAAAVLTVPYTEEVGKDIVDTLFQIGCTELLQPHIPVEIWRLMKRRPSLPPVYCGLQWAGNVSIVAYVRRLGDIEMLKSLFLLVWGERCNLLPKEVREMETAIRTDFGGIGMEEHRKELGERLDQVLENLDQMWNNVLVQERKGAYKKLKDALLEVDRG
jgi:hypothetical protein